jgi:Ca2+-binding RTX toxin-like protein
LGALLAAPRPALATYTATISGLTATMNGDADPDELTIYVSNGRLRHSRFIRGDPDYASDSDFNTAIAGTQPLTATVGATLTINAGGGNDTITIDSFASQAGITVNVNAGGGNDTITILSPADTPAQIHVDGGSHNTVGGDTLVYNDINGGAASNIVVTSSQVAIPQGGASVSYTQVEGLTVSASQHADAIDVHSTAAATPVQIKNLQTTPTIDVVTIGDAGSTRAIFGTVGVSNQGHFTRLVIDDSADPTGRVIGIADGTVAGIAPATIAYSITNDIQRLTLKSGNGADRFNISTKNAFVVKALAAGGGDDTFAFANQATLTGAGTADGGAGSDTLDYSAYTTGVMVTAGSATGISTTTNMENAIGGPANDMLYGRSGADSTLIGGGGADLLQGGSGNDILVGGPGADTLKGGAGDDLTIWGDGDGNDTFDGGPGANDRAQVSGSATLGDRFAIDLSNSQVMVARSSPTAVALAITTTEQLAVYGGGGSDTITASAELAGVIALTLSGEAGDDTLQGGGAADVLSGGAGNDRLEGGAGRDTLEGGAGDDQITWNDGDGNDTIAGDTGSDSVRINGSNTAGDRWNVAPAGARVAVARSAPLTATLDLATIEQVAIATAGGDDTITVIPLILTGIAVDGGAHSAGDILNFNRQGLPVTRGPGTISVPGRKPVTHTRIETVNIISVGSSPGLPLYLPFIRK